MQPFVKTIHARGILSFARDSEPLALTPLNVLIGPNASGKSNLIEVFELLKAAPTDLGEAIEMIDPDVVSRRWRAINAV